MKKIIVTVISALLSSAIHAQEFGAGAMINHLSNGILLSYSPVWNKNWDLDAGLRITLNIPTEDVEKQGYLFYQSGYAKTVPEYLGLNIRLARKLVNYRAASLWIMSNLYISNQSVVSKHRYWDINPVTQQYEELSEELYFKPSPAADLTIGPLLRYNISNKVSIAACVGYGIAYMHHKHVAWSKLYNKPVPIFNIDQPKIFERKGRGAYEIIGLDGLPMISFVVKYKLK